MCLYKNNKANPIKLKFTKLMNIDMCEREFGALVRLEICSRIIQEGMIRMSMMMYSRVNLK